MQLADRQIEHCLLVVAAMAFDGAGLQLLSTKADTMTADIADIAVPHYRSRAMVYTLNSLRLYYQ